MERTQGKEACVCFRKGQITGGFVDIRSRLTYDKKDNQVQGKYLFSKERTVIYADPHLCLKKNKRGREQCPLNI